MWLKLEAPTLACTMCPRAERDLPLVPGKHQLVFELRDSETGEPKTIALSVCSFRCAIRMANSAKWL